MCMYYVNVSRDLCWTVHVVVHYSSRTFVVFSYIYNLCVHVFCAVYMCCVWYVRLVSVIMLWLDSDDLREPRTTYVMFCKFVLLRTHQAWWSQNVKVRIYKARSKDLRRMQIPFSVSNWRLNMWTSWWRIGIVPWACAAMSSLWPQSVRSGLQYRVCKR